jgi:hypothetical protein
MQAHMRSKMISNRENGIKVNGLVGEDWRQETRNEEGNFESLMVWLCWLDFCADPVRHKVRLRRHPFHDESVPV